MRDITMLHPDVQTLATKLVDECAAQGLIIKITDCVRTQAEQDTLYAQGRTTTGAIVTNASYPKSNHNWGIAFDFCRNDGTGAYRNDDDFFDKVGAVGKSIGLFWGGDFTSITDKPHFQITSFGDWNNLLATYGTPEAFVSAFGKTVPVTVDVAAVVNQDILTLKELQSALNADGYRDYEGKTLVVDGISGRRTQSAIEKVIIKVTTKQVKGKTVVTYEAPKSKGEVVRFVQKRTGSNPDGLYGMGSKASTVAYQHSKGLSPDGIVGKNTINSML